MAETTRPDVEQWRMGSIEKGMETGIIAEVRLEDVLKETPIYINKEPLPKGM